MTAGNGGAGLSSSYSGTPTFYAGGGGGATPQPSGTRGTGGSGGGGNGSKPGLASSTGGTNTGGGCGGNSGNGGSGIVIIRYSGSQGATGGTITNPSPGAYTIHTFTGPGTFSSNATIAAAYSVN